MGTLLGNVSRWILGKTGVLLILIVALLLTPLVLEILSIADDIDLIKINQDVGQRIAKLAPTKNSMHDDIGKKLDGLRKERTKKENERDSLKNVRCLLPTCSLAREGKLYKVELEIDFLTQAISYSQVIQGGPSLCVQSKNSAAHLAFLRMSDDQLNKTKPPFAPVSPAHQTIKDQIVDLEQKEHLLANGCSKYKKLASSFDGAMSQQFLKNRAPFIDELKSLSSAKIGLVEAVKKVLPVAVTILVGIIFMPILVSALAYFVVAPISSESFGVNLLPESVGELSLLKKADYEQEIDIDSDWELLIDPALVKVAPDSATKKFKLLLDHSMPMSSLLSGLYFLTSIQSESKGTVTISAAPAMAAPSAEASHANKIAVIDLPANAALVLQPRCLAGILQPKNQKIRITRHWRIGNISSWLTLQLRYIVFHGPAKLIVKGNDGVSIGMAESGIAINQSSTLGFNANLKYGVSRSATFYAYLSGKQQLFDDNFSSGPGFYILEVTPKPLKDGLFSNPIPVIINTILKAFGLG